MRITTKMISNQYTSNLNSSMEQLNRAATTAYDFRAFEKPSENPFLAGQTYQVRRQLSLNDCYTSNIENLQGAASSADSVLQTVSKILTKANSSETLQGITGTSSLSDRKIIAEQLRELRKSIIEDMNTQYGNRYLFAGAGEHGEAPFSVDASGNLLYRGINVDSDTEPDASNLKALAEEHVYVDIGFGLKTDAGGNVIDQTAYDASMPGISFLGYGTATEDGVTVPKNVCSLLSKMADILEDPSLSGQDLVDKMQPYMNRFNETQEEFTAGMATVGRKSNVLTDTSEFLTNVNLNLTKRDESVEFVDAADAITNYSMQMFSYQATLQVGSNILQPTLLDFMK